MRDNYRPVTLVVGHDCTIADTDIDHPAPLDWDSTARLSGSRRALTGIKVLPEYTSFPADDRSFHDCEIRSNDVSGFEEGASPTTATEGAARETSSTTPSPPCRAPHRWRQWTRRLTL